MDTTFRSPKLCFGATYRSHKNVDSGNRLLVDAIGKDSQKIQIDCEALIGADGVGSTVRKNIGVSMQGQKSKSKPNFNLIKKTTVNSSLTFANFL